MNKLTSILLFFLTFNFISCGFKVGVDQDQFQATSINLAPKQEEETITITLPYSSRFSAQAKQCELRNLDKLEIVSECQCIKGECSVQIKGVDHFAGIASLEYSVGIQNIKSGFEKVSIEINEETIEVASTGGIDTSQIYTSFNLVDGDILYLGNNNATWRSLLIGELIIYDISTPESPVELSRYMPDGVNLNTQGIYKKNNLLYINAQNRLCILDVINPSLPVEISCLTLPSYTVVTRIQGNYAFVGGYDNVHVVDISNPASPSLSLSIPFTQDTYSLEIKNNLLFVAETEIGVKIYDISNPLVPVLQTTIPTEDIDPVQYESRGIVIKNNFLIFEDGNAGFKFYDISSPTSPIMLANIMRDIATEFRTPTLSGNKLFIYHDDGVLLNNNLFIYDISDFSSPSLLKATNTRRSSDDIADGQINHASEKDGYLYISSHTNGLKIIEY